MKHGIYIYQNEKQEGPFSEEQIAQMLEAGDLSYISLAWREGLPDWKPLNTLINNTELSKDRDSSPSPPPLPDIKKEEVKVNGPKGVGGWLVLFCVALTILGPLISIGQMMNSWEQAQPAFDRFPILRTAVIWENFGSVALLIYGFIVGCIIWSGSPNGRAVAKTYLLVRLFGSIGIGFITLVIMGDMPSEMGAAVMGAAVGAGFRDVIYFLIWWFYFKKSKRVRNTYGAA